VDILRPATVLELGMMAGRTILPFIVEEPLYEIDYPDSLPVVEAALRQLQQGKLDSPEQAAGRHPV
jgi:hypothetical protein